MFFSYKKRSIIAIIASLLSVAAGQAQISKAQQILINRGLQLQGMVTDGDVFHLENYSNAYFTSINWIFESDPSRMGPAPGYPWGRWVGDETQMPPQGDEGPFMSQLVSLQLADEWNMNDDAVRTRAVNWFNSVRTNFPNTILLVNNFGGQVSDSALGDFINRGNPDMISFDSYPFKADYNTRIPIGGTPINWYGDLRRYRQFGISAHIPFAAYMQTFHAVEDYDSIVYRNPSPSEMRLNNFAALAYNAKQLAGFTYNTGASSLFTNPGGDTYMTPLYNEQLDINRRAVNLGKALVCLMPVPDLHNPNDVNPPAGPASTDVNFPDGTTTSILHLKGNPGTDNATPLPIGFQNDPQAPRSYSWWENNKNDPYLTGWTVTNKGTNNGGLPGEVIIAWFKPLHEGLDGTNFSNEIYMMVVNGLTATNGTAADCLQEIKLNFLNSFTSLLMLDPETGVVSSNTLPIVSTRRQLVLSLNGGDAALFKFADGAPFVGRVAPAAARLTPGSQGGNRMITLQGTMGARYQLQSTASLANPNWTVLTNTLLAAAALQYIDGSNGGAKFYRAVGIP